MGSGVWRDWFRLRRHHGCFFGGGEAAPADLAAGRALIALVRVQIDLATAVFGGEQDILVDTATCASTGSEWPRASWNLRDVQGTNQPVRRSFLGQVMTRAHVRNAKDSARPFLIPARSAR